MVAVSSLLLLACIAKDAVDVGDSGIPDATDTATEPPTGVVDDTASGGDGGDDTSAPSDDTATGDTATGDTATGDTADTGTSPPEAVDYRLSGGLAVSSESRTLSTATCDVDVMVYTPDGGGPLVVLGHGFLRGGVQLNGWAEHYASWGLTVAVPDLCHSSVFDTDHEANGADMVDIAEALGGPAVYAGHSAGGLAALLAAGYDASALGVLGLDAVDAFDLGVDGAGDVDAPVYGVFGESSLCNASNNGVTMYAGTSDSRGLRVTEADHCDFEFETDWVCTVACTGSNDAFSEGDIRDTILGLTTAGLMELAGLDSSSGWWAAGGEYYDALVADGAADPL